MRISITISLVLDALLMMIGEQPNGLQLISRKVMVFSVMRCASEWRARAWMLVEQSVVWLATSGAIGRKLRCPLSWFGVLLVLGLVNRSLPASAIGTVQDVKLLPHSDGVRIVVDLGRKVPFEQRTFSDPPRLVLDLPDVSWQLPKQRSTRSYRFVRGFRFGQLQEGISRLVVDVDGPFKIDKVFELPPSDTSGYRIVTDLLPLPFGSVMTPQRIRSRMSPRSVSEVDEVSPPRPAPKPRAAHNRRATTYLCGMKGEHRPARTG